MFMKLGPRDTRQFFDSTYFSIFTLQNFLKDTVFKEHLWVNVCVRINFNVFSFLNKMCIYTGKKKLWSSRKIGLNQRGPLLEIMLNWSWNNFIPVILRILYFQTTCNNAVYCLIFSVYIFFTFIFWFRDYYEIKKKCRMDNR